MVQRSEHLDLDRDVSAPRAARTFVARTLSGWSHGAAGIDRFQLLVSELVSNAVLHGAGGTLTLSVSERDSSDGSPQLVRIAVRNDGEGRPLMRQAQREESSGRGLRLIDELSHRWGSDVAGGHTVVWFEADPEAD